MPAITSPAVTVEHFEVMIISEENKKEGDTRVNIETKELEGAQQTQPSAPPQQGKKIK